MEISLLCHVVLGSLPIESRSDISEHMLNFLDFSGISGQNQVDVNFLHSSGITGENQVDVNFLDFSGITGGNQVDVNFLDFSGITGGNQVDVNFLDFSAIDAENKVDGNTSPTDHQFELLETRPRFTSSHNFILKEILSLSGVNGPETERELFARASDAFQRENLRSIGFSSFATHLRRLQKTKTTALSMLPSQLEALEQFRDCSLKFDQAFEAIETKFRSKNIPLISKAVCKKVWNSLGLGAGRLKISRAHIRIIERLVSRHHYQPTDRAVLYKKACKLFAKAGLGPISMRVFIEHHTLVQRNTILTDLATDQLHDDIDSPQPSPISQPDYSNNVLNPSEFILIPPSDNNSEGATFINLLPPNWDQESISFPDFNLEKVQETTPSSDFNSEGANIIDLLPLNWNQETIQLSEFNSEKVQETTPPSDFNSEGANIIDLLPLNWAQETIQLSDFNSEGANFINLLPPNWAQESISFPDFNLEMVQETTPPSDFNSEGANIIDLLPLNWAQETIQLSDFNSEGANYLNLPPVNWAQESISFPDFNLEMVHETTPTADVNLESSNYLNLPPVNWAQESISFPDFNLEMVQETTPPADVNSEGANIIDLLPLNWNQETIQLSEFNSEKVQETTPTADFNSEGANIIDLLPLNWAQESIQLSDFNSEGANFINLLPLNWAQESISFPDFNLEKIQETTPPADVNLESSNYLNLPPVNWAQESISFPDFNLEMVQETTPPADVNSEGANIIDLLPLNWNQETAEPSDFNSEVSNFINLLPVNAAQETISSVSGNYITLIPVNLGDLNPSENTQGATSDLNSANFNLFPPNWANALDSGSLIKPVSFQSREELIEARWTPRHWEILINLVRSVVMFDLGCIKFDSQLHQEGLLQIGKSACEEAWQMLTSSRGENDNTLRSRSNYALHDRIIKSFLLEGTRKPSDLYTQASALFSSADIPPMSKRLFNSHWFSLQCELEHEFGGNSKRCYSARHRQILKEIVQENPDMRHKNILRLATEKFAQEGLIAMTFNTLGPWVTQIKKMQTLSFDNTEAKIDMNADALLTCIFNSSPTIRLPDAMNALREFGNLGGRMLSREEVRTWLANRRKSFRFSLGI